MTVFARTDRSVVGRWWWSVDLWSVAAITLLVAVGVILSFAASPAVATRIGQESSHFMMRQLMFLVPALGIMFVASLLTPRGVLRLSVGLLAFGLVLLALTLLVGTEIKGARRWLDLGVFSIQPSEFVKPAFIVVVAYLFSEARRYGTLSGFALGTLLFGAVAALLVLEPDFGQTFLISLSFGSLVFLSGVSWMVLIVLGAAGLGGIVAAYNFVPHVTSRIDRFLHPESGDTFQVDMARKAITHGGLTGVGPGEGRVKNIIPDAHADFIFAVAAEEYGLVLALALIALFGFVVLRGLLRAMAGPDSFNQLAAAGLFVLFGLQAFINIGVNVNLLPAKGMTLPFISYGGSSLVALALGMGMALALTRRRASYRLLGEDR